MRFEDALSNKPNQFQPAYAFSIFHCRTLTKSLNPINRLLKKAKKGEINARPKIPPNTRKVRKSHRSERVRLIFCHRMTNSWPGRLLLLYIPKDLFIRLCSQFRGFSQFWKKKHAEGSIAANYVTGISCLWFN